MKNMLYLASKSPSRQQLLQEANIPFMVLLQTADEASCDWGMPLDQLVASIALHKMECADLSPLDKNREQFVLTADTLSQDEDGTIQGKPKDQADAVEKIKRARAGTRLCTAFCLDKKVWKDGAWQVIERIQEVVHAQYTFIIPDEWIEQYFASSSGLHCSNAIAVEGYGGQFLKEVRGSYTAIVGLPLFELRQALSTIGFF